jgi:hypothetical protein
VDLKNLDIEFLLDKSGSMSEKDCPGGKSRWDYAQETTLALARLADVHDPDGISVTPFAGNYKTYDGVTSQKVAQVFQENFPMGGTNTAAVLQNRLDAYFTRKAAGKAKSTLFLVLTDGEPTDRQAVANVIVDATKKMDRDEELAIQFIQIGKDDGAANFLKFLDDGLTAKGAKFDIVDTVQLVDLESLSFEELIQKSFAD